MAEVKTLVLNASYAPIAVVPLHRAVILVMAERAEIVEETGEYLHSPSTLFPIPSIIRLVKFVRIPFARRVPVTRRAVLQRDNHVCGYCGGRADTIDHIKPRALGGKHTWLNVAAACRRCNGAKGSKTLEESGMTLRIKPFEPAGTTALVVVIGKVEDAWAPYLA
jgi:5-methylcytosine-specific restriction endonuclease McrA